MDRISLMVKIEKNSVHFSAWFKKQLQELKYNTSVNKNHSTDVFEFCLRQMSYFFTPKSCKKSLANGKRLIQAQCRVPFAKPLRSFFVAYNFDIVRERSALGPKQVMKSTLVFLFNKNLFCSDAKTATGRPRCCARVLKSSTKPETVKVWPKREKLLRHSLQSPTMPDTLLTEEKLFRIRLVTIIRKKAKNIFVQFSFKSFIVTSR